MAASSRPSVWDVWNQIVFEPVLQNTSDDESIEGEDNGNVSDIDVPLVSEEEEDIDNENIQDVNDDNDMNEIVWSEANQDVNVRPFTESTGPQVLLNADVSELECFNTFFTNDMINKVVQETNQNASRKQQQAGRNDPNWIETNFAEMSAYLGM